MKKTLSLKLMLLGLFALVSGSALAAVGDIFEYGGTSLADQNANGTLYYQEVEGGAKVIGVKTVGTGGVIVIPTTVYNTWYTENNDLSVIAVDDNWSAATRIDLVKVDANGNELDRFIGGTSKSLLEVDFNTLKIDAADLKTISTKVLQPLNGKIEKFIVTADAGLTAIPAYAFFNGTLSQNSDIDPAVVAANAAIDDQIAIVNNRINGFADPDFLTSDGKPVYVVKDVVDGNGNPIYVFPADDEDGDGYADAINAYNGDAMGVSVRQTSGGKLKKEADNSVYAERLAEAVPGLQKQFNDANAAIIYGNQYIANTEASEEYQQALATLNAAKKKVKDAEGMKKLYESKVTWNSQTKTVSQWWLPAQTGIVVDAVEAGSPDGLDLQSDIDLYNNIMAIMALAKYTDADGTVYKYAQNANNGYDRPNSDDLEADLRTAQNALTPLAQSFERNYNMTYWNKYVADAEAKKAAVEPLLAAAKAEIAALQAQKGDPTIPVYTATLDNNGKIVNNTVLKEVTLIGDGSLADFGTSCFENCVAAKFIQTNSANLPASTVNIAPRAFFNASIAPIFGKLTALETIGKEAFANSKATTANFQNSPNLYAFGEHVFDNCKLTNLLLKGTAIEADPEGPKYPAALAQYLYQETPKFIDDCGYFYNYDVENAEDLAALKTAWKAKFGKDMTPEDIENLDLGEAKVNTTLTKVTLPENIKAIPDEAFMNDIALATLDVIPAGVAYIGDMAFFRTQIKEFDLSLLVNLYYVGDQAFAGNKEVTKVILPQGDNTKLQALGDEVFECNGKLAEVVLGPEITCLPEGTFAGNNSIKVLDLSNTKIEVLHNLFGTGEVYDDNTYGETFKKEFVNTSLKKIILPKQVLDEDNYKEIIPGLKVIMPGALAFMQGLGQADDDNNKWGVEIPSTVFFMGDMAFYNCNHLETVTAIDSRLTTIGRNTFRGCDALTDFYFVTLQMANNQDVKLDDAIENYLGSSAEWNSCGLEDLTSFPTMHSFLDDHAFFFNNSTTLHMTKESIENLRSYFTEHGFTNFREYVPELTMNVDGTAPYFNKDYATWISMYEADVYTCYQDVVEDPALNGASVVRIYMIKAKHNQGYYKIPAATTYSSEGGQGGGIPVPIGENPWRPVNGVYQFPGYNDTFMDWYVEGPAGTDYTEGPSYNYTPSAAVIIRENDRKGPKDGKVPYERHSADELINQSTLDPANQLMITRQPIGPLSSSSKLMQFTHPKSGGNNDWIRMTEGTIKAGRLVLPLSAGASNGNPGFIDDNNNMPFPSRIEVIWVDDDMTGIEDVKSYIKSLNDSEAIYNLQGVKVTAPVKGQLYIQGGKKFIQK